MLVLMRMPLIILWIRKKTFVTPEFAMTYSTTGKGGVSRNFHRWARMYKLSHADSDRDIFIKIAGKVFILK